MKESHRVSSHHQSPYESSSRDTVTETRHRTGSSGSSDGNSVATLAKDRRHSSGYSPLLVGAIPIISSLLFHGSQQWIDLTIILVICMWIYYLLKSILSFNAFPNHLKSLVPWTLFLQSRRIRYNSSERFFIVLIFVSPLIASYSIHVARSAFTLESKILEEFSIPLFLLTAFLRPVLYFMGNQGSGDDLQIGFEEENKRLRRQMSTLLDRVERMESIVEQRLRQPDGSPDGEDQLDSITSISPRLARNPVPDLVGDRDKRWREDLLKQYEKLLYRVVSLEREKEEATLRASSTSLLSSILTLPFLPLRLLTKLL